jgi:hypothetical protein
MRLVVLALALALCIVPLRAIEWTTFEGSAHGFPVMRDAATGKAFADGNFQQWIENGKLHVVISYAGAGGRRIEERVIASQRPELIQDAWTFTESRDGRPFRRFDVDFASGHATAVTYAGGEKHEEATLKITRGQTFAGFGFTLVMKGLRDRLMHGEHVTLQGVGFMPKPRLADVDVSYAGRDRIRMSERWIEGDRFIVHPKIPAVAKLFVHVPDASIWLTTPPAGFLRWEGALAQPDDEIVRVDLMPGASSGPAEPVATSGRAR